MFTASPFSLLIRVAFLFVVLACGPGAIAQGKLIGVVKDAETGERIDGASVYINNTSFRTQTSNDGVFRFSSLPQTNEQLVISHAAYHKLNANFRYGNDTLYFSIVPKNEVMEDVVVKTKVKDTWKKWGKVFTQYFIGANGIEKRCRITNPEVLRFYYDKNSLVLKAFAGKPLILENDMLGYRLHIDLESFSFSFNTGVFAYTVTGYYEALKDSALMLQYAANRLQVYRGSRLHFMRSLYRNNLVAEGFKLYQYSSQVNRERERVEALLLKRRGELNAISGSDASNIISADIGSRDSAKYYKTVMAGATYIFRDTLPVSFPQRWRMGKDSVLSFSMGLDSFLLAYESKPLSNEDKVSRFARSQPELPGEDSYQFFVGDSYRKRYTLMYLKRDGQILVRQNGLVLNSGAMMLEGYLSNRRIAYDLPWDYDPAKDEAILEGRMQTADNSQLQQLVRSLEHIRNTHQSTDLYLHLDKTLYDHGENIWFSAYVVRSPFDTAKHHTLFVSLANKASGKLLASQKFIMQEGWGAGYIFLPDSLAPGVYLLNAYTNTYGEELNPVVFQQEVRIVGYREPYTIAMLQPQFTDGGKIVYAGLMRNDRKLAAAGAEVQFRLMEGSRQLMKHSAKLDESGGFKLPPLQADKFSGAPLELQAEIGSGQQTSIVQTKLVAPKEQLKVQWFPEGGALLDGVEKTLAFRISKMDGRAASFNGLIREGSMVVAQVQTNELGFGAVSFKPARGKTYVLESSDEQYALKDSLPVAVAKGVSLHLSQAVVSDSVVVDILGTEKLVKVSMLLHNYSDVFHYRQVLLREGREKIVIGTWNLPAGLSTITVFDEEGLPLAERAIFKHPENTVEMLITTDTLAYGARKKVNLSITTRLKNGQGVSMPFSLACVQANRIDTGSFQHITPYSLLHPYFSKGVLSKRPSYYSLGNNAAIELFLLTECWTRYRWSGLAEAPLPMRSGMDSEVRGRVLAGNRPARDSVSLMLISDEGAMQFKTDGEGRFRLSPGMMITGPDRKLSLIVATGNNGQYRIVLDDDHLRINDSIARRPYEAGAVRVQAEIEATRTRAAVLETVVVRSGPKMPDQVFRPVGPSFFKSTTCSDWVCMYNILNCVNHKLSGDKPVEGQQYSMRQGNGMITVTYAGCKERKQYLPDAHPKELIFYVKGRTVTKEFYIADYEKHNPADPELLTTVYWNPRIITDASGEAKISFYTNDIKGTFMLIAEGLGPAGAAHASQVFKAGSN